MKILITGAAGFLGQSLVQRLWLSKPELLRCLIRSRVAPDLDRLSALYPQVELVRGNLLSMPHMERLLDGIDTVYHLAAGTKGSAADIFRNSVVASKRLLEGIARNPAVRRIVLVSSFAVYETARQPRGMLIDEGFPLEPSPELRDPYSFAKAAQESLFRKFHEEYGRDLIVVRPGVIYGQGANAISPRVGIQLSSLFLHLGGANALPLTHVTNCAEGIALAGEKSKSSEVVNIVDDDLPTCREFLRAYCNEAKKLRCITLPYVAGLILARLMVWYDRHSNGQILALITPYRAAALWKGFRFTNAHLKDLGWKQVVSTDAALRETFASFRLAAGRP